MQLVSESPTKDSENMPDNTAEPSGGCLAMSLNPMLDNKALSNHVGAVKQAPLVVGKQNVQPAVSKPGQVTVTVAPISKPTETVTPLTISTKPMNSVAAEKPSLPEIMTTPASEDVVMKETPVPVSPNTVMLNLDRVIDEVAKGNFERPPNMASMEHIAAPTAGKKRHARSKSREDVAAKSPRPATNAPAGASMSPHSAAPAALSSAPSAAALSPHTHVSQMASMSPSRSGPASSTPSTMVKASHPSQQPAQGSLREREGGMAVTANSIQVLF